MLEKEDLQALRTIIKEEIKASEQRTDAKLAAMEQRTGARFDGMQAQLDRVEDRLDHVEDRLGHVEVRLDHVEDRLGRVEDRLGKVEDLSTRTALAIENEIRPAIGKLADGYELLLQKIDDLARKDKVEDEMTLFRTVLAAHSRDIAQLKKAQ